MPQKSKFKLPPLNLGKETLGQRIAKLRKKHGYSQTELAKKIGITQKLVSDYETGRLRPSPEMVVHFALALGTSTDALLGLKGVKSNGGPSSLKIHRRMKKIEDLPDSQQRFILKTIDSLIKAAEK